jgi:hypothetical protein
MFHLEVDPDWYERFWYSNRPRPKRRPFASLVVRFALLVGLMGGGGAWLSLRHAQHAERGQTYDPTATSAAAATHGAAHARPSLTPTHNG